MKTVGRLARVSELPSSTNPDFEWPTHAALFFTQASFETERPDNPTLSDELWRNPNGAIWVPYFAMDLKLRVCIISHTGPS